MSGDPVMVAMSGGVDSSVAAARLVAQGRHVVGVTLKLWGGASDSGCCSVSDVDDARRVAQQLGIDHHVFNFGDDFDRHVVTPYVEAHVDGRTPNPCIQCNRHLKFDRLLRRARALGFERIATGHHARIVEGPSDHESDRRPMRHIGRGADPAKDQSYVLYMLDQAQLACLELPIGHLAKDEVRAEAARLGLRTAHKPDSQDVCFITATGGRSAFLGERVELTPGRVVDGTGAEVGRVDAVQLVTIGQRKGLRTAGGGAARYVTSVDLATSTITVGSRRDLLDDHTTLHELQWAHGPVTGPVTAQVSAHGRADHAHITGDRVRWDEPHQRVAPGQSVVLYRDDVVLGGGIAA
ncbi:MAG: tRNA 2-thiouridine(34) synthase MnmA [Acidimicrobiia bacterium]|nr:tRNA 2-thiouridine(34) synthase MnmA [Acidimicrobiia bacterium]